MCRFSMRVVLVVCPHSLLLSRAIVLLVGGLVGRLNNGNTKRQTKEEEKGYKITVSCSHCNIPSCGISFSLPSPFLLSVSFSFVLCLGGALFVPFRSCADLIQSPN